MGDVHDPVADSMAITGEGAPLKAEIGEINQIPVRGLRWKDKPEIIIRKKKAVYIAVGTAKKMIGFI